MSTRKRTKHQQQFPEPTEEHPSLDQLERWTFDSVCESTDGCTVEPDGQCQHGHVSWLRYMGYV